jgi:predicted class III extradiol MEMO1 family dioxygenase
MKDIFLAGSLVYKKVKPIVLSKEFFYDKRDGLWRSATDNALFVNSSDFAHVGSKKRDMETGEDQK